MDRLDIFQRYLTYQSNPVVMCLLGIYGVLLMVITALNNNDILYCVWDAVKGAVILLCVVIALVQYQIIAIRWLGLINLCMIGTGIGILIVGHEDEKKHMDILYLMILITTCVDIVRAMMCYVMYCNIVPLWRLPSQTPVASCHTISPELSETIRFVIPTESTPLLLDQCVICLIDFRDNDVCCRLECKHMYHKECIEPWLRHNGHCPLCRFPVKAHARSVSV